MSASATPPAQPAVDEALKRAAHIYCERSNLDPRQGIPTPHPLIEGAVITKPLWARIAADMADLQQMISCIAAAQREAKEREAGVAPAGTIVVAK